MLKNKILNDWNLFWLITAPISLVMVIAMTGADLSSGTGISEMIQLSVRCAVPLLYLTFAASALQIVFPTTFSRWLLKNRKYMGLCFAAAMAWQLFFILWMVLIFSDYYIEEVYVLRDAIEGVGGYLFLLAMTVTSFKFARKKMSPKNWRLLHKTGIYFLWAYAFSVYWWALFYYKDPLPIDYVFYWTGFLAWALRAAAWAKRHKPQVAQMGMTVLGYVVIAFGLIAASFGRAWQPASEQYLSGYTLTKIPELYMPYWPFEPFLPLFVIALGVYLLTRDKPSDSQKVTSSA
ncbi:MAG: ferric reductase-like transmembrane domain-containing protein [Pseudomonadota bacterium]